MYSWDSLKLTFVFTTIISLLILVGHGTPDKLIKVRVGETVILGPCEKNMTVSNTMVRWEVYKHGKKTDIITAHHSPVSKRIRLDENIYGESNLEITKVIEKDAGRYICFTGPPNNLNIYVEMELVVHVAPKLKCSSVNQTVNEGDTLEIWCNASGVPIPQMDWFRSSRVNDVTSYERIGISGNILRIKNVTRYARDMYMCNASNEVGYDIEYIKIDVTFPAQLQVQEKELQRLATDLDVEIVCAITANPMVDIVWYKGDEKIINGEKPYKYTIITDEEIKEDYYTIFSILKIIPPLDQADFDVYYCKANDSRNFVAMEQITLSLLT